MTFRIKGLDPTLFQHLYGLSDESLTAAGAIRYSVTANPGFPDRIEMRDLEIGESALLVNFLHQPANTPYQASHAVFVREGAENQFDVVGKVPEVMGTRPLSVRAFDSQNMMIDAHLIDGKEAAPVFKQLLFNDEISYLQIHNAIRGCYSGLVEPA